MTAAFDLITLCWLGLCAVQSARAMMRSTGSSIDIIVIAHFFLCGFPLGCDLLVGVPEYGRYPGFLLAAQDGTSRILYCLYVSACPILWWATGRPKSRLKQSAAMQLRSRLSGFSYKFRAILLMATAAPLVMIWFAPSLDLYAVYSTESRKIWSQPDAVRNFHMYLSILCSLSVIAAAGVLLGGRSTISGMILILPFLLGDFWFVGKRYIVAVALALIVYALWYRGVFRQRLVACLSGVAVLSILITFSIYYQSAFRSVDTKNRSWEFVYDSMRVDFGRDHVIRMAIYAEVHPEQMQILDFRGQSLWIYASLPVPRTWWQDKPISYGTSVACEAMLVEKQYLGWSMTTSILEEAIANFSWFGMLCGPLLVSFVCRVGDSCHDGVIGSFTAIIALMMTIQHLTAFAPIVLVWIAIVVWSRLSKSASRISPARSHFARPPRTAAVRGPTPPARVGSNA